MMFLPQVSLRICVLSAGAIALSLLAGAAQASMVHSFGEGANQFQMDFVRVGHVGNAADTRSGNRLDRGSVGHVFDIGTYHVTNPQYAAFLNTVATVDDALYSSSMGNTVQGGIDQGGSAANFSYSVKTNFDAKPVNYVSFYDAARFTNWLTTGDTEKGVYSTYNAVSGQWEFSATPDRSFRNAQGKAYFLPSEEEWYKAAYYQGTGATYWESPTHATDTPATVTATATGDGSAGGSGNFANFNFLANWNGSGTDGNVTTVGTSGGPNFYGAYDMAGNVWDWIETVTDPATGQHGRRGGSFGNGPTTVVASGRFHRPPGNEDPNIGIRVASVSDLLAYEGFNYTGTALAGQDGGYGFSGAWIDSGGNFAHLTDGNLNSPAFPFAPSGRHISGTGGSANRPLPGIFDFGQDGVLYLSGLFHRPTSDAATSYIWGRDDTKNLFRMGLSGGNHPLVGFGGTHTLNNSITLGEGETFFLVAKIEASESDDDTISLKVYGQNDRIDLLEPISWDVTHTADMSGVFNDLRLDFPGTGRTPAMDEIRIGTTWRSVAVPEPTSLLLLLSLGVVSAAVRPLRRRKRA